MTTEEPIKSTEAKYSDLATGVVTLLDKLKPLINTRPMFGVFAIGDGSGRWFCAACGRKSPLDTSDIRIDHTAECQERAHWLAIGALKQAIKDWGEE
jgi:hypothetical protein